MNRRDPIFRDPILDSVFSSLLNGGEAVRNRALRETVGGVKTSDENDEHVVKVALPGIKADDLELDVQNNHLMWRIETSQGDENNSFVSRTSGSYYLGDQLDSENIAADLSDGVLSVSVPYRKHLKPRSIEITSGGRKVESKEDRSVSASADDSSNPLNAEEKSV